VKSSRFRLGERPALVDLGIIDDLDYARLTSNIVAVLALVGASASMLVLVYPGDTGVRPIPVLLASACGMAISLWVRARPEVAPARRVSAILTVATVALGGVLLLVGADLFPYAAIQFVWVSAAFPFVTRRRAVFHLVLALAVCGLALAVQGGHWDALVMFEMVAGTLVVAAGVVEWVVGRITQLALDQRAARHELEEANIRLEGVNRQKREFLAATSHELRTPLNAILGFSDVLGQGLYGPLNARQSEYVDDIRSSGQHLLALIDDVLDVSKVESGRLELEVADVAVESLVGDAVALLREQAAQRGVTVDLRTTGLGRLEADERKLRQVFVNLLANAIQFTPAAGRVTVTGRAAREEVIIDVHDTGPGIAVEDQERIFRAFEQGRHAQGGTGLGLALARRFVHAHGGTLTVRSEPGRGSTFTCVMPRTARLEIPAGDESGSGQPEFDSEEARRRNTRVVTTVSLSGVASGMVALLTLLARGPLPPDFRLGWLLLLAIPSVGTGLLLRLNPTALNVRRFIATYFLFITLVSAALYLAGPTFGPSLSGWNVWGALALFMLLPPRRALLLLSASGVSFGFVLAVQPGNFLPVLRWIVVMSACVGPGLLMVWLMDKLQTLTATEHQARLEVERSWLELEQVSRHKTEFLANMSHELRTPLNAVIGFAEVLKEELFGPLNAKQAEYIDDIVDAGRQLLALINDILDLAKAEAGHVDLMLRDVALAELVQTAVGVHSVEVGERHLRVAVSVDPAADIVRADALRLGRALANLLSNAVKFSPEGGEIDVRAVRDNGEVIVAVRDSGPGIAPADQARIFDEFQQVSPATLASPGAGLGLTLARTFAELHHGWVEVESEPGQGSTFRLAIPQPDPSTTPPP
jgi:signal transduction histidine kinase